ncbi:hypothetical protein CAEBREN_25734 [Caenorhabditis brenneri]|uniref:Serpentine receptor class r-10 n=1 Tax=Caenorhabditis brenneri TaxID=135651 RepID=G0N497_CAEBE|nr:hypothetical protein CAEBREN_25734 [Caenorhabditis brenneri]
MLLTFENWKLFLRSIEYSGAFFAIFFNAILMVLIVCCSPKHFGMYKYLMAYISVFEVIFAILDCIIEPNLFTHGPVFIVFRQFSDSYFGRNAGFYLIAVCCGNFGLLIALFGVHFIYRYGAIDIQFRVKYLMGKKLIALFLMPVVFSIWWTLIIVFLYRPDDESDKIMREPLLIGFETQIENVSYIFVQFYSRGKDNQLHPNWVIFGGMGCMWFMISLSLFCVFYFGIRCYSKILKNLKHSKWSAYCVKTVQQELFNALAMQTLIPLVLMYIPVGTLFLFPMLNIEVGFISSSVMATIAIYPAVDPLPTMFIVKNYRYALLNFCRKPPIVERSVELQNQPAAPIS